MIAQAHHGHALPGQFAGQPLTEDDAMQPHIGRRLHTPFSGQPAQAMKRRFPAQTGMRGIVIDIDDPAHQAERQIIEGQRGARLRVGVPLFANTAEGAARQAGQQAGVQAVEEALVAGPHLRARQGPAAW